MLSVHTFLLDSMIAALQINDIKPGREIDPNIDRITVLPVTAKLGCNARSIRHCVGIRLAAGTRELGLPDRIDQRSTGNVAGVTVSGNLRLNSP